jgi:4-aminobutyrate aminotransferase
VCSVVPDILIMAKGIASGYPLSAIASTREIMDRMEPGSMGGTYAGNAVACAAACATIDAMREEDVLANAHERGVQLRRGLQTIATSVQPLALGDE